MKNIAGTLLQIIAIIWIINGVARIALPFLGSGSSGSLFRGLVSLLLGWGLFRFGTWLKQKPLSNEAQAADLVGDRSKELQAPMETEGGHHSSSLNPSEYAKNAILATDYHDTIDRDSVYRQIAEELEAGAADKGIWIRLFAECGGDETQTKVLYIRQRADFLIYAERIRLESVRRESAAEAARIEEGRRKIELEEQRLREKDFKLKEIRSLAEKHKKNPRMMIGEKEKLLSLAGGSFTWLDRYGRCSATFRGEEKQFSSGKEFSNWFISDIVPSLLSIRELE